MEKYTAIESAVFVRVNWRRPCFGMEKENGGRIILIHFAKMFRYNLPFIVVLDEVQGLYPDVGDVVSGVILNKTHHHAIFLFENANVIEVDADIPVNFGDALFTGFPLFSIETLG